MKRETIAMVNRRRMLDDSLAACETEVVTERVAAHLAERMGVNAHRGAFDIVERVMNLTPPQIEVVEYAPIDDDPSSGRLAVVLFLVLIGLVGFLLAAAGATAYEAVMAQVEAWRAWR